MDNITKLIRSEIKNQYKSVHQFSKVSGVPYSTLSNALTKGIGGTSYETVVKICTLLNLKQVHDTNLTVLNQDCHEICTKLTVLDEKAVNKIKNILNAEHQKHIKKNTVRKPQRKVLFATKNFDGLEAVL